MISAASQISVGARLMSGVPGGGRARLPRKLQLAIGIKTLLNNFVTPMSGEDDISVYGVELAYKIRGFSFVTEYAQRTDDIELTGELDSDAYYVQAGYLLPNKKLEFALRIAEISPDTPTSTDIGETGIAASYYLKKEQITWEK